MKPKTAAAAKMLNQLAKRYWQCWELAEIDLDEERFREDDEAVGYVFGQ